MSKVFNNPYAFVEDALAGFCALHGKHVIKVPGGVVRAQLPVKNKVSVILGGGSGHYPAFYGFVGPGFADGAIVGNIFTSPSAHDAINVASAASNGAGVIIASGNYAGDVLHFSEAAQLLTKDGIPTKTIFVTDDIASATQEQSEMRRGIAGGFAVFKILSAAAEAGYNLEQVFAVGARANERTKTLGVAFGGCTLPGEKSPLFEISKGQMAVGLGIHGEQGISEESIPTASDLARTLVTLVVAELGLEAGSKVAVILNGLGSTKMEELFTLWNELQIIFDSLGLVLVEPEVGELVTSLDMQGLSLTIVALDDELEIFWRAAADTPAFKKHVVQNENVSTRSTYSVISKARAQDEIADASKSSKRLASFILSLLTELETTLTAASSELGRIDAVAGDGDHGRGMVTGIGAAIEGAKEAVMLGAGARQTLESAGAFWSRKAGGTSGALWGAALISMGSRFDDRASIYEEDDVVQSVSAGLDAIVLKGKASLGDKTMVDSLHPFVFHLRQNIIESLDLATAWNLAAKKSTEAAQATATLTPRIGRARPMAEKSIGTPDAGATSMSLILETVGRRLLEEKANRTDGGKI